MSGLAFGDDPMSICAGLLGCLQDRETGGHWLRTIFLLFFLLLFFFSFFFFLFLFLLLFLSSAIVADVLWDKCSRVLKDCRSMAAKLRAKPYIYTYILH
jgi:hypothetical protein